MNEKELLVFLAKDNDDTNLLLAAMNENTKGNFQFKKMKIRRLIKKDLKYDFIAEIMFLFDRHGIKWDNYELPVLLKRIAEEEESYMIQYLVVKKLYPDFISDNFATIVDNANQGREPFYGLHGFDNDRDLELFYQHDFDDLQAVKDEADFIHIVNWFEGTLASLDDYKKRLTGVDLPEFDQLINTKNHELELLVSPRFLPEEDIRYYQTLDVPGIEEKMKELLNIIDGEGVKLALYLAYLEVGMYNIGTKPTLLDSMQRCYLAFRIQLMETIKTIDDMISKTNHEELEAGYDELEQKMKIMADEHEAKIKELNEQIKTLQLEKETSVVDVGALKNELLTLQNQIAQQETLAKGYQKMLIDDFSNLKMLVIYKSQLLYAPLIYPDVKFLLIDDLTEECFAQARLILIQSLGGSAKQKRELEVKASTSKCEIINLHCKDERQLILEIARIIDERRVR